MKYECMCLVDLVKLGCMLCDCDGENIIGHLSVVV